jgi:hypothetical protein
MPPPFRQPSYALLWRLISDSTRETLRSSRETDLPLLVITREIRANARRGSAPPCAVRIV